MTLLPALGLVIALSVVASALLAPPIYALLLSIDPSLPWPYSRVYNRVILLTTVIALFLARKKLHLVSLGTLVRAVPWRIQLRHALWGFLFSSVTGVVALIWVVHQGRVEWDSMGWGELLVKLLAKALPTAVVVSILEELIFRGVFYRILREKTRFVWAALLSSLIYAFVHFIEPDKGFAFMGWSLGVGFAYLAMVLERIFDPAVLPALLCLTAVGVCLCLAVERTKSLALAVGLHGGWIMAMKFAAYTTTAAPTLGYPAVVGRRYFLLMEPVIWGSVLLAGLLVCALTRHSADAER